MNLLLIIALNLQEYSIMSIIIVIEFATCAKFASMQQDYRPYDNLIEINTKNIILLGSGTALGNVNLVDYAQNIKNKMIAQINTGTTLVS